MNLTLNSIDASWWPYVFILLAAALPTNIWRWVGVLFGSSINEKSAVLVWVKAVATALIGGVIAQLILFPVGAFAQIDMGIRLAAVAAGVSAFWLVRRNILIGVATAELALVGLHVVF